MRTPGRTQDRRGNEGSPRRPHPLPAARHTRALATDLLAGVAAFAVIIVGLWVRHGGIAELTRGWADAATSITQLTGLLASAFGLVGVALVGRPRSVERHIGLDRMFVWHRILGETMTLLVGVHIAAALVAWSASGGFLNAVLDLTGRQPYMALATVGSLLIAAVTISSLASVRRRMSYETWYFVHLAAYAGFALSFGHQLVTGETRRTSAMRRGRSTDRSVVPQRRTTSSAMSATWRAIQTTLATVSLPKISPVTSWWPNDRAKPA
jgi:DMSO/TMAO reductase YedYZ heme-binding membrane subunit